MKIIFKTLHIENFMSFESADISFDVKGYTLVTGKNLCVTDNSLSNGSGKSSIWEAISWCLTGETIRGAKEVKRLNSDGACRVVLSFLVDADSFTIERVKSPSKLIIIRNDKDVSGKGIRDSEKILSEYLPDLTPDLIGSVIILGQGLPKKFSNNTPSGRKDILEKLSKSSFMIEDIKARIAVRKTELSNKLREQEDARIRINATAVECDSNIRLDSEALEKLVSSEDDEDKLRTLEQSLENIKSGLDSVSTLMQENDVAINRNKEELQNCVSKESNDMLKLSEQYTPKLTSISNNLSGIKGEITALQRDITRLKNVTDVCPTCGQKLPGVSKPNTTEKETELYNLQAQLDKLQSEYIDVQNTYKKEQQKIIDTYKGLKEQFEKVISSMQAVSYDLSRSYTNGNRDYADTEKQISELTLKIKNKESIITLYKNRIEQNTLKKKECDEKILYIDNVITDLENHISTVNKIDTTIKRDFRGYLLGNLIRYINSQAKSYCMDVFNTAKIGFALDGNNISISYDGKEYENLSGGEKQKVDLIVQFSIRDMLCKYLNFSSNILVLDEITDNLDAVGCQKVFNLITNELKDVESIYIISHHTELQFPIDFELSVIKKEDGISYVE